MFATRLALVALKSSTGIVGLRVVPDARNVLSDLYMKTLSNIKKIPPTAEYRKSVEAFTNYRLNIVQQHNEVPLIEEKIGCGQIEELIEQARDELDLLEQYAQWKMWEGPRPIENLEPEKDSPMAAF